MKIILKNLTEIFALVVVLSQFLATIIFPLFWPQFIALIFCLLGLIFWRRMYIWVSVIVDIFIGILFFLTIFQDAVVDSLALSGYIYIFFVLIDFLFMDKMREYFDKKFR